VFTHISQRKKGGKGQKNPGAKTESEAMRRENRRARRGKDSGEFGWDQFGGPTQGKVKGHVIENKESEGHWSFGGSDRRGRGQES